MILENKLVYNCKNVVERKPITAEIYLTNYCNNKCGYCFYTRNVKPEQKKYMSYENFVTYAKRLLQLGVQGFILTGGGEPTINPDFDKITKWLEENNIAYGINTNFNVLRKIKPVFLKVSLDGFDRASYKNVRGVDTYDRVIQNIKDFIEWKKETGAKTNIGVQSLICNADDVERFYNSVKSLEIDYISFRPLEIPYEKKRNADDIIQQITFLKTQDSRVSLSYKWYHLNTKFEGCPSNFAELALDVDGTVLYCCQRPNERVGHILDDDILKKKKNYKIDFSKCDVPCRLTGANASMLAEQLPSDYMFI